MQAIHRLINRLTPDEDLRQELWVYYLEGIQPRDLSDRLQLIHSQHIVENDFRDSLQTFINIPPNTGLSNFLDHFSDPERQILFLLALGCSLGEIIKYNGTNVVRIHQMMVSIQNSNLWESRWRLKENSATMKSSA
jgi:hypothetical protein